MTKIPTILLLTVGCGWALFVIWLFLTIAGVAGPPQSATKLVLYWGAMLFGPLLLIVGAILLLYRTSSWLGFILEVAGCVTLSILILYNSILEMLRTPRALEPTPPYVFYGVLIFIMVVSDLAAYKIYRARRSTS